MEFGICGTVLSPILDISCGSIMLRADLGQGVPSSQVLSHTLVLSQFCLPQTHKLQNVRALADCRSGVFQALDLLIKRWYPGQRDNDIWKFTTHGNLSWNTLIIGTVQQTSKANKKKCAVNIAVAMFKQLKETRESLFCDIIFNSREAIMIPVYMMESYWDLSVCTLLFVLSPSYQVQCASFRGQLPHVGSATHWVSLLPRLGHHFPVTALWC